ncbi:hypothetical protein WJX72_009206 [[Myrmecia] bisecta]|uniref:BZIP domain-containing protein n=1 Tax=[Myrmecia] bisecta TaxID=41462 RepID=A0AAW1P535_9CHLO
MGLSKTSETSTTTNNDGHSPQAQARRENRLAKNRRTAAASRAKLDKSEQEGTVAKRQLTQALRTLQAALPRVEELHVENQQLVQKLAASKQECCQLRETTKTAT